MRLVPLLAATLTVVATVSVAGAQAPAEPRVLAGLSQAEVRAEMEAFNRALGVDCAHCHVQDRWDDGRKPAFTTGRNMIRMVRDINDRLLSGIGKVSCWSCHGGQVKPSRVPAPALEARIARWPANLPDEHRLAMSVYSVTLGVACDFCHVGGDWTSKDKRPMQTVERMTAMFSEFPRYMPASARTQCWMCHKGARKPQTEPPPVR